jgi:hypothetical protein
VAVLLAPPIRPIHREGSHNTGLSSANRVPSVTRHFRRRRRRAQAATVRRRVGLVSVSSFCIKCTTLPKCRDHVRIPCLIILASWRSSDSAFSRIVMPLDALARASAFSLDNKRRCFFTTPAIKIAKIARPTVAPMTPLITYAKSPPLPDLCGWPSSGAVSHQRMPRHRAHAIGPSHSNGDAPSRCNLGSEQLCGCCCKCQGRA